MNILYLYIPFMLLIYRKYGFQTSLRDEKCFFLNPEMNLRTIFKSSLRDVNQKSYLSFNDINTWAIFWLSFSFKFNDTNSWRTRFFYCIFILCVLYLDKLFILLIKYILRPGFQPSLEWHNINNNNKIGAVIPAKAGIQYHNIHKLYFRFLIEQLWFMDINNLLRSILSVSEWSEESYFLVEI